MKDLFTQWKLTHNKAYKLGHEEEHRFNVFADNYLNILKINQEQSDVELGLNQFADLTQEEFGMLYTGYHHQERSHAETSNLYLKDLPNSVDWREKGAVTPVKNQGACGSCWAFSAIGALEGLYFIDHNELLSFSEQNFVDCVRGQSKGCQGGWMNDAFDYTAENGVETEADYPYTARTGKCSFVSSKAHKVNTKYVNVTRSAEALKTALVAGPVSVAIQANQAVFQFYKVGVIKSLCGAKLDHGVLAVGYETISGTEAYIIKNSWGSGWGQKGYTYISTNGEANKGAGVCGILEAASYPTSHN